MRYPLHCRRMDKHPAHDWTGKGQISRGFYLSARTYHCTGRVIHSLAEYDDADDDYEARLDREKRDVA